jgi:hypothetical protein
MAEAQRNKQRPPVPRPAYRRAGFTPIGPHSAGQSADLPDQLPKTGLEQSRKRQGVPATFGFG